MICASSATDVRRLITDVYLTLCTPSRDAYDPSAPYTHTTNHLCTHSCMCRDSGQLCTYIFM